MHIKEMLGRVGAAWALAVAVLYAWSCTSSTPKKEAESPPDAADEAADAGAEGDAASEEAGTVDDAVGDGGAASPPPQTAPVPAPAPKPAAPAAPIEKPMTAPAPAQPEPGGGGGIISSGVKPADWEECKKIEKFDARKRCFEKLLKNKKKAP